jgi:hypothetical protein
MVASETFDQCPLRWSKSSRAPVRLLRPAPPERSAMTPASHAVPISSAVPSDRPPSAVLANLTVRRRSQLHRRIQLVQLAQLHRRVGEGPIAAVVDAAARAERIRAALRAPAVTHAQPR